MMIKDLEMSKYLDRDSLSSVRGGSNSIKQGGVDAPVAKIGVLPSSVRDLLTQT